METKQNRDDKGWMVLLSICIVYIDYIPTDIFMQHKCMTLYYIYVYIFPLFSNDSYSLSLTHFNSVSLH